MNENGRKGLIAGAGLILAFLLWTVLILKVDVQPAGVNGTDIGMAGVNTWFHGLTGVHLWIYSLTDMLELLAIAVCAGFGLLGLSQWIRRKSLKKVDPDLILLGIYYILVILGFLLFEKIHINYRPVLIDGKMEGSYPSSTTLLVLSVMPTLIFQVNRRVQNPAVRKAVRIFSVLFAAVVAGGRLISGVHWLTDIIGAVLLSAGLYMIYRSAVILIDSGREQKQAL